MSNSKDLCLPLCLPFECLRIDTSKDIFPSEPASHYYVEGLLSQEGEVRLSVGGEEETLLPGEARIICPGMVHFIVTGAETHAKAILMRCDPNRIPAFPAYSASLRTVLTEARKRHLPMRFSAEETARLGIAEICESCLREAETRDYGYDIEVISRMVQLSVILIRYWRSLGLKFSLRESKVDPIYSLPAYIQMHLHDNLRVEELAADCGLSYPWFAKKFREIFGLSCKDYIEQIRVAQVEQYLRFTDMDLSQISEVTGYADCSHMIKNFKRLMGTTPGQYRMKNKL